MKHTFMIILFACTVALVGCQMNNDEEEKEQASEETVKPKDMEKEDLPGVRAFQEEFTRGFLQSTKETRPGYYPFLSGTGAFVMDFPEEGMVGEKSYNRKDKSYEGIKVGVGTEHSNITQTITVRYFDHLKENIHKDSRLGQIQSGIGEDLDFKRSEEDSQVYYISAYERDKEEYDHEIYGYAALVLNNSDLGGIHIVYTSRCQENCEGKKERTMQEMHDWIKSVQFLEELVGSDENDG